MNGPNLSNMSFLDRIMHTGGIKELQKYFNHLIKYNPDQASNFINDEHLHFATLFVLQTEFREFDFAIHLNSRNRHALELTESILLRQTPNIERLSSSHRHTTYSILKWMLETGYLDDGLSNQFDEVLETSAVLLIKQHKDNTILPVITEMIFSRYRKGLLIYDLVWAFFEARSPKSLTLIANGLRSAHFKDVELSRKLLDFIPCIAINDNTDPAKLYLLCLSWLQENHSFLYYTGESFQQTCKPMPYKVLLEAKYLCKGIFPDNKEFLIPLTMTEYKLIEQFNKLDQGAKTLLSDYSFWLYRQDLNLWNKWHRYPVLVQLNTARNEFGGIL